MVSVLRGVKLVLHIMFFLPVYFASIKTSRYSRNSLAEHRFLAEHPWHLSTVAPLAKCLTIIIWKQVFLLLPPRSILPSLFFYSFHVNIALMWVCLRVCNVVASLSPLANTYVCRHFPQNSAIAMRILIGYNFLLLSFFLSSVEESVRWRKTSKCYLLNFTWNYVYWNICFVVPFELIKLNEDALIFCQHTH